MWRALISNSPVNCDIDPVDPNGFRLDMSAMNLPGVRIVQLASTPLAVSRSNGQAANGDDGFNLSIVRRGRVLSRQSQREVFNGEGDAMLWSNDQMVKTDLPLGGEHQHITIPRQLLKPSVPDLDSLLMTAVPRSSTALRLLTYYVTTLLRDGADMSPDLQAMSAKHIQDLVALTLGATRDAAEIANGRGVRVARMQAIKADIEAHLAGHDLSLDSISRRHGISPRYVRALFDGEGTSFTDYVLGRRLLRARHALADGRNASVKISTIAFESGFGDLSYFNLAFRRHFGMTPSEARAQ